MSRPLSFASLLLFSSALIAPSLARAQASPSAPTSATPVPSSPADTADQTAADQTAAPGEPSVTPEQAADQAAPEVSIPGGDADIVVVGSRNRNLSRTTAQVVSVLSSADIARTGEGNIAGSLARVTGLSVVGNGFVYVRGLGDRYSLALLNGSPLPSPEPLRRVVPLDIFPTSVIASSLVQKSYSVNFPGEFGGGVINLTTKAVPKVPFLTVGAGIGLDTVTTGQLGYTHFGSASDWTGFDNGQRNTPPLLAAFFGSGRQIAELSNADNTAIAAQLIDGRNAVIQRNRALPPNWSGNITGGKSFDLGSATLGVIATAGYGNTWRTRDTLQQSANANDLSQLDRNFQRVITDNRIVVNGLLGLSLEFGQNKVRSTSLYIRDTLKQTRLGLGTSLRSLTANDIIQEQDTAWFERQLIDTQFVGEFKLAPELSLDVRGSYGNTQRESPNEISLIYTRQANGTGLNQFFGNGLGVRGDRPDQATIGFSDLDENLYSAGVDLGYKIVPELTATVGYAFTDTQRRTAVRGFAFRQNGQIPQAVTLLRPDLLLGPAVVTAFPGKDFFVRLVDNLGGNPTFDAKLRIHGAYGQVQAQFSPKLSGTFGVRYETAVQTVLPVQVFTVSPILPPVTNLNRNYWLPAATVTYQLAPDMQVRVSGSKTIARPQFRELVFQTYFDPEINTAVQGNPLLIDSQLYNAEARYEWYFARDQRISFAGFYKRIDNPIEVYADDNGNTLTNRFANAPKADLYGAEIETQKYFPMTWLSGGDFFTKRRALVIANYTFTKSRIIVGPDDPINAFPLTLTNASQLFRNGVPLTGQSDHLANVQLGLEEKDHLSQQTFLFSYASRRVTRRGPSGQPDIFEQPGLRIDFVARQGVRIGGVATEMKFEARNITGTPYQEFQENGNTRVFYNRFEVGTIFNFGLSVNF